MANETAVAKQADAGWRGADAHFPYGIADSTYERMIQGFSSWAGVTAFFAAIGSLGFWLIG